MQILFPTPSSPLPPPPLLASKATPYSRSSYKTPQSKQQQQGQREEGLWTSMTLVVAQHVAVTLSQTEEL